MITKGKEVTTKINPEELLHAEMKLIVIGNTMKFNKLK